MKVIYRYDEFGWKQQQKQQINEVFSSFISWPHFIVYFDLAVFCSTFIFDFNYKDVISHNQWFMAITLVKWSYDWNKEF